MLNRTQDKARTQRFQYSEAMLSELANTIAGQILMFGVVGRSFPLIGDRAEAHKEKLLKRVKALCPGYSIALIAYSDRGIQSAFLVEAIDE
jgi:hypothetical protein